MKNKWSVIGLNEDECHVAINSIDYRLKKESAAIVHAIMCLCECAEEIGEKIEDLEGAIERKTVG